ncbi:putative uncharacterized protein [Rhodococcus sp. AW25M09]|nr:putative uncharacterized protein [Rhodococcus sp. AW25M09]
MGTDAVERTNAPAAVHASPTEDVTSDGTRDPVPDRVTVTQPAHVDTNVRPADVPVWPGPDPSDFLVPNPPAGEIGRLAGAEAEDVFVAAQKNPGEFWNVGGVVLWLVVT